MNWLTKIFLHKWINGNKKYIIIGAASLILYAEMAGFIEEGSFQKSLVILAPLGTAATAHTLNKMVPKE